MQEFASHLTVSVALLPASKYFQTVTISDVGRHALQHIVTAADHLIVYSAL